MRLLVCGPRNLDNRAMPALCDAMRRTLLGAIPFAPGFVLAHGAARGADMLWEDALAFTYERRPELWMPIRRMPARWRRRNQSIDYGAGPKRNQLMLETVQPTYWLAAHWSEEPDTPGTADMVRRLRGAGVPGEVVLVPRPATSSRAKR